MDLEALRPDKGLLVLSLSFIGILLTFSLLAMGLEVLLYGEIQDVSDGSSADMFYLLAMVLATYAQASFAKWFLDSE